MGYTAQKYIKIMHYENNKSDFYRYCKQVMRYRSKERNKAQDEEKFRDFEHPVFLRHDLFESLF